MDNAQQLIADLFKIGNIVKQYADDGIGIEDIAAVPELIPLLSDFASHFAGAQSELKSASATDILSLIQFTIEGVKKLL